MIQLLTHFLKEATDSSTNGHPAAYIATTLRNEATLQRFLRDAAASDLLIVDISAQAREGNMKFQHHLVLEPQRSSIFVHEIVLSNAAHAQHC